MDIFSFVEQRIASAMELTRSLVYSVARFTSISNSTASGNQDSVDGQPGESSQDTVRRMGTWGVRSVPPQGVACLVVRAGGGATNGVVVGCESTKYGPSDLQVGEVAIYCTGGSVVKLDKDGNISVTQGSSGKVFIGAPGGMVPLNDGVVLASGIDPFTGATYGALGSESQLVMAKKV